MQGLKQQNFGQPVGLAGDTLVPLSHLSVSVLDAGFIHGVTVSEQVRTFRQEPFLLREHYRRWVRGLVTVGLQAPCSLEELASRLQRLIHINARFLPPDAEQGICFFSTPGPQSSFLWSGCMPDSLETCIEPATCFAHSYPLPVERWKSSYQQGVHMSTTSVQDVSSESWPQSVKIRSRLHYFLAQRQAEAIRPGSHPILLDSKGMVSDSAIGSVVGYDRREGMIVRPSDQRFSSISVDFVVELATSLGICVTQRPFSVRELQSMQEAFLVSTPWCLLPVASIDGKALKGSSNRKPFEVASQLLAAWSDRVGVTL